jgi:hypothetical protein
MPKPIAPLVPFKSEPPPRQARWENEGGALLPATVIADAAIRATRGLAGPQSKPEQPRLYADLLAEADRRRLADDIVARGIVPLRDPTP